MAKSKLPFDHSDLDLNPRQLKFIGEYVTNGYDEAAALKAAGIVAENASTAVIRLNSVEVMNTPGIKKAIARMNDAVISPYRDKLDSQLREIWSVRANYKISDFYESDGTVKQLDEIPKHLHHAIDKVVEDFKGKDADRRVVNYVLADKAQAAKFLRELMTPKDEKDSNLPDSKRERLAQIWAMAGAAGAIAGMQAKKEIEEPKPVEGPVSAKTILAKLSKR